MPDGPFFAEKVFSVYFYELKNGGIDANCLKRYTKNNVSRPKLHWGAEVYALDALWLALKYMRPVAELWEEPLYWVPRVSFDSHSKVGRCTRMDGDLLFSEAEAALAGENVVLAIGLDRRRSCIRIHSSDRKAGPLPRQGWLAEPDCCLPLSLDMEVRDELFRCAKDIGLKLGTQPQRFCREFRAPWKKIGECLQARDPIRALQEAADESETGGVHMPVVPTSLQLQWEALTNSLMPSYWYDDDTVLGIWRVLVPEIYREDAPVQLTFLERADGMYLWVPLQGLGTGTEEMLLAGAGQGRPAIEAFLRDLSSRYTKPIELARLFAQAEMIDELLREHGFGYYPERVPGLTCACNWFLEKFNRFGIDPGWLLRTEYLHISRVKARDGLLRRFEPLTPLVRPTERDGHLPLLLRVDGTWRWTTYQFLDKKMDELLDQSVESPAADILHSLSKHIGGVACGGQPFYYVPELSVAIQAGTLVHPDTGPSGFLPAGAPPDSPPQKVSGRRYFSTLHLAQKFLLESTQRELLRPDLLGRQNSCQSPAARSACRDIKANGFAGKWEPLNRLSVPQDWCYTAVEYADGKVGIAAGPQDNVMTSSITLQWTASCRRLCMEAIHQTSDCALFVPAEP